MKIGVTIGKPSIILLLGKISSFDIVLIYSHGWSKINTGRRNTRIRAYHKPNFLKMGSFSLDPAKNMVFCI